MSTVQESLPAQRSAAVSDRTVWTLSTALVCVALAIAILLPRDPVFAGRLLLAAGVAWLAGATLGVVVWTRFERHKWSRRWLGRVPLLLAYGFAMLFCVHTWPAFARTADRAQATCAQNLREISSAWREFIAAQGRAPGSLQELQQGGYLELRSLRCPSGGFGRNCDYYYLPEMTRDSPAEWLLAIEGDLANHDGRGVHVLFVDGRVDFLPAAEMEARMQTFELEHQERMARPPTLISPQ